MTAIAETFESIDHLPEAIIRISNQLYRLKTNFEDIQQCALDLEKDLEINSKNVAGALEIVITQIPSKMNAWAALTRVISVKKALFASDMINLSQSMISLEIGRGNLRFAKYWLRYLAALLNLNMINQSHFMLVLEMLLGVAKEPNTPLPKADGFVYLVLATLPWACEQLHANVGLDLTKLVVFIATFMGSRQEKKESLGINRVINAVTVYRNVGNANLYDQMDVLPFFYLFKELRIVMVANTKLGIKWMENGNFENLQFMFQG